MRLYPYLIISLLATSCNGFSTSNHNESDQQNYEVTVTNEPALVKPAYSDLREHNAVEDNPNQNNNGQSFYIYHNDNGEVWISHSQEEEDEYQMMRAKKTHYKKIEKQNNFHNWESEDVRAFYVLLDGVSDSDQAEYYANEYYDGEYIEEWGSYYAKTYNVKSGEYEIELGERVNNKFFKISGTDLYILFKWSTSLFKGDEGVLDVWSAKGTFYINPNN